MTDVCGWLIVGFCVVLRRTVVGCVWHIMEVISESLNISFVCNLHSQLVLFYFKPFHVFLFYFNAVFTHKHVLFKN